MLDQYVILFLTSVFIASCSQVLLKKSANKKYDTVIREYFNPYVIVGYSILLISTFMVVYAYQQVDLKYGPILESTGYIYILIFGHYFFNEKLSSTKLAGVFLIIAGIIIFSC